MNQPHQSRRRDEPGADTNHPAIAGLLQRLFVDNYVRAGRFAQVFARLANSAKQVAWGVLTKSRAVATAVAAAAPCNALGVLCSRAR